MPFQTYKTEKDYSKFYESYTKGFMWPCAQNRAKAFVSKFKWNKSTKLCIVGCGFGWLGEALTPLLLTGNILQVDTSEYIQVNKINMVHNLDVSQLANREMITTLLTGKN